MSKGIGNSDLLTMLGVQYIIAFQIIDNLDWRGARNHAKYHGDSPKG